MVSRCIGTSTRLILVPGAPNVFGTVGRLSKLGNYRRARHKSCGLVLSFELLNGSVFALYLDLAYVGTASMSINRCIYVVEIWV